MDRQALIANTALWKELEEIANRAKRSVDEILGEAVAEYVQRHRDYVEPGTLPSFVGMLSSETSDTSERAEAILAEEMTEYLGDETQR